MIISLNNLLRFFMPAMLLLLLGAGVAHAAFVEKISIYPLETPPGIHPQVVGTIKAGTAKVPDETAEIHLIASLYRPDNTVRSWTWKKILIKAGEKKFFSIPNEYDVKDEGVYKVDFAVYSKDMWPVHKLSKTFSVVDPARSRGKQAPPHTAIAGTATVPLKKSGGQVDGGHMGIGVTANIVNTAAGATLLYWPFRHAGLQAAYTGGLFTTTEGRLLARFPRSSGLTPYVGIGYARVNTERMVDVINITSTFSDSGMSGVIGVEFPLGQGIWGTVEISGADIELKTIITSGGQTGYAEVEYSPVMVGFRFVYYLF